MSWHRVSVIYHSTASCMLFRYHISLSVARWLAWMLGYHETAVIISNSCEIFVRNALAPEKKKKFSRAESFQVFDLIFWWIIVVIKYFVTHQDSYQICAWWIVLSVARSSDVSLAIPETKICSSGLCARQSTPMTYLTSRVMKFLSQTFLWRSKEIFLRLQNDQYLFRSNKASAIARERI